MAFKDGLCHRKAFSARQVLSMVGYVPRSVTSIMRSKPFFHKNRENPMLVLSRKLGEKIVIGDNIVITVVKIDRNQIRIGIEAPQNVPVYREEIAPLRTGKPV